VVTANHPPVLSNTHVVVKPDVFVIYDRLTLADPERRPCWMTHCLRKPRATGIEQALTAAEIGPQFLWNGREQVSHPSPGGQVWMGGDGFAIESGSPGKPGDGWLSVRKSPALRIISEKPANLFQAAASSIE